MAVTDDSQTAQGYFSILRWRPDATRDEARNIAVLLVEARGHFSRLESAPLSRISPRLHEQGILDSALLGLQVQFSGTKPVTLERLTALHERL